MHSQTNLTIKCILFKPVCSTKEFNTQNPFKRHVNLCTKIAKGKFEILIVTEFWKYLHLYGTLSSGPYAHKQRPAK